MINMKTVKFKGLDIKVPKGTAFAYETPPMMPKGHMVTLAVGKRGSGKGVATTNLISNMKYDRIFVISPTFKSNSALMKMLNVDEADVYDDPDDPSAIDKIVKAIEQERDDLVEYQEKMKQYRHFLKLLNDPNKIVPDELLVMFYNNGNFEPPKHRWGGKRPFCCLICDDLQGSKIFTNKKIDNLTIMGRHVASFDDDQPSIGLSIVFQIQNYKSKSGGLSRAIRNNATNMILFKNKDKVELDFISSEMSGEFDKEVFMRAYEKAVDEPHSFLFVDLHKKDHHPSPFRKQFNTFLVPEELNKPS